MNQVTIQRFRWKRFPSSFTNFSTWILASEISTDIINKLLLVYPKKTIYSNDNGNFSDALKSENRTIKKDSVQNLCLYNNSVILLDCTSLKFDDLLLSYFQKLFDNDNHLIIISTEILPSIVSDNTDLFITNETQVSLEVLRRKFLNKDVKFSLDNKKTFFAIQSNYPEPIFGIF